MLRNVDVWRYPNLVCGVGRPLRLVRDFPAHATSQRLFSCLQNELGSCPFAPWLSLLPKDQCLRLQSGG